MRRLCLVLPLVFAAFAAPAQAANPWIEKRAPLNIAHQGGEDEFPSNTMYAFRKALRAGADMLELDIGVTEDDKVIVMHDTTVEGKTNGSGTVASKTLRQLKRLDAAYWFAPGRADHYGHDHPRKAYRFRGIATGKRPAPKGFRARDFRVPSLARVLRAFPDVPINIEIKGTSDTDDASFQHNATLLAKILNRTGRTDIIVTSFNDPAVETFHSLAPQIALAPGRNGLTAYFLAGVRPIDGTVAIQIPVTFSGIPVATPEFMARAHADGYAVHVWFSGTAPENEMTYNALIDACADGLMSAWPTMLEQILDQRHIARPGTPGLDPCSS